MRARVRLPPRPQLGRPAPRYPRALGLGLAAAVVVACGGRVDSEAPTRDPASGTRVSIPIPQGAAGASGMNGGTTPSPDPGGSGGTGGDPGGGGGTGGDDWGGGDYGGAGAGGFDYDASVGSSDDATPSSDDATPSSDDAAVSDEADADTQADAEADAGTG